MEVITNRIVFSILVRWLVDNSLLLLITDLNQPFSKFLSWPSFKKIYNGLLDMVLYFDVIYDLFKHSLKSVNNSHSCWLSVVDWSLEVDVELGKLVFVETVFKICWGEVDPLDEFNCDVDALSLFIVSDWLLLIDVFTYLDVGDCSCVFEKDMSLLKPDLFVDSGWP